MFIELRRILMITGKKNELRYLVQGHADLYMLYHLQ
jgi:hypothetical protein